MAVDYISTEIFLNELLSTTDSSIGLDLIERIADFFVLVHERFHFAV